MTKLIIREYIPNDFINIEPSPIAIQNRVGQPMEEWGHFHAEAGRAATAINNASEIVFCLGVHHRWSGLGELWAVYSPLAQRYPMVVRYTQLLIEVLFAEYGYRRLQAAVNSQFPVAVRFIEHLGFTQEGVMRAYGPTGDDHLLYALVREE